MVRGSLRSRKCDSSPRAGRQKWFARSRPPDEQRTVLAPTQNERGGIAIHSCWMICDIA